MSEAAQKLLEQIRALPDAEREWLFGELDGDDLADVRDDPEIQAMLAERLAFAEQHPNQLFDGDEVMAEARQRVNVGE